MKSTILVKDIYKYIWSLKDSAAADGNKRDIVPDFNCGMIAAYNNILSYLHEHEFKQCTGVIPIKRG